jgi:tartrate dehydratase beta subunit/fumarate hydratase class I family protein
MFSPFAAIVRAGGRRRKIEQQYFHAGIADRDDGAAVRPMGPLASSRAGARGQLCQEIHTGPIGLIGRRSSRAA